MNDYRYMDMGPEPEPTPWWKTPRTVRLLVAAVVGLAVVVGVIIYIVNFSGLGESEDLGIEDALQACESSKDPEACIARVKGNAAKVNGPDACDGLQGDGYASCISTAAYEQADPDVCGELSDAAEQGCRDAALLAQARQEIDLSLCEEIATEDTRGDCSRVVTERIVEGGICAEKGVSTDLCDAEAALEAAIAIGTKSACRSLRDEGGMESCLDVIFGTDKDSDGLSLAEESDYRTSDNDADTDGDGYSDLMEIANGFNPLQ